MMALVSSFELPVKSFSTPPMIFLPTDYGEDDSD